MRLFSFFILIVVLVSCNDSKKQDTLDLQVDQDTTTITEQSVPPNNAEIAIDLKKSADRLANSDSIFNTLGLKKRTTYFFSHKNIGSLDRFEFDDSGVKTINGDYNPTDIASFAQKCFINYRHTGSEESKKLFLTQADWAKNNFTKTDDYGFWLFSSPRKKYGLIGPWSSALTQGLMISVCLSAYEITADKEYLDIIQAALKGFRVPVSEGGFTREIGNGYSWYEEYPTKRPSRVLNGIIYGLIGVYQYYEATGDEFAFEIFEEGIEGLLVSLDLYDARYTSRYSLADWKNEIAKDNYHEGHVLQLLWLYHITKEEEFKKYAKIFFENDRYDFRRHNPYYSTKPLLDTIVARHSIDPVNKGPEHLFNGKWSHGVTEFWSSHRNSELKIGFKRTIDSLYGITLYHFSQQSAEVNFDLFARDSKGWRFIQHFDAINTKDMISVYNKTGKHKTFIRHYKVFQNFKAKELKLVFETGKDSVIALRELNFLFDKGKEFEELSDKVKKLIDDNAWL